MGQVFQRAAQRRPEATALVDAARGVRYTYRTWYQKSTEVASALSAHGIEDGDVVATAMRNRVELSTLYCATQLLGAVFVPFKFRLSADELERLVDTTNPVLFFVSDEVIDAVDAEIPQMMPDLEVITVDSYLYNTISYETFTSKGDPELFTPTFVDTDEPSIILHTSGATGKPKGVPRSHRNTYAAGMAHIVQNNWARGEATLGMMSLSHTMGIHTLAAILLLDGKLVIQRRFSVDEIFDCVESEQLTSLYLIPTVYHDLFKTEAAETIDFSSVRHISYAGSSMNPTTIRAIEEYVDPETFVNHYGSTEIYTHTVCDSANEKLNCLGRAGINTNIRVVEPADFGQLDPDEVVEPEELGELIIDMSSPEAFDGYLTDDNGQSLVDGWFFTGDLGYRDEADDLWIVGRVDDMIISGGENIYPVEVEQVLESYDLVEEAAVVGRPSDRWNQTVAAFITLTINPSEVDFGTAADALDNHCRQSDELANFKRPRKYFFIDGFDKSYVGKILRNELQKKDLDITVYGEIDV